MKNRFKMLLTFFTVVILVATVLVFSTDAVEVETVYVTLINEKVTSASGNIFTKDYNGTNKVQADADHANFVWAYTIAAEPTDKDNVYEVTFSEEQVKEGEVTIPEGGFIYSAHCDNSQAAIDNGTYKTSEDNYVKTKSLEVGDLITISGIDLAKGEIDEGAVIYLAEVVAEEDSNPSDSNDTSEQSSTPTDESSETESSDDSEDITDQSDEASSEDNTVSQEADSDESTADSDLSDDNEGGLSTEAIIGIVAGAVVLIIIIAVVLGKKKK